MSSALSSISRENWGDGPRIGISYSPLFPAIASQYADLFDYVEVPFELLEHDATACHALRSHPIVLHCASLSLASHLAPKPRTIERVQYWIDETATPWLGEHLAFVAAERCDDFPMADEYAPGEPYNIGFTVSPPMNEASLATVCRNLECAADVVDVPIIVENSPIYFRAPGTTFSQTKFINEVCDRASVGLLLDLTHLAITASNLQLDASTELKAFPLAKVVEIHVSGMEQQQGVHWDHHASDIPEAVLELLAMSLELARPRAITVEYNWIADFGADNVAQQLRRVHEVVKRSGTRESACYERDRTRAH